MEMRKHDFVGKERRPFKGSGAVGVGATDQFMLAVGQTDETGFAELADEVTTMALRNQVFQFHTPPRYGWGLDIGGPCQKKSKPKPTRNIKDCIS
jgi:hypothetical protein